MHKEVYDLKSNQLPYLSGFTLKIFTAILESPFGSLIIPSLLKSAGIVDFRKKEFHKEPTNLPIHYQGKPLFLRGQSDALGGNDTSIALPQKRSRHHALPAAHIFVQKGRTRECGC